MKYLLVVLTLYLQDLYTDNYKMLLREVKGDFYKWRYKH